MRFPKPLFPTGGSGPEPPHAKDHPTRQSGHMRTAAAPAPIHLPRSTSPIPHEPKPMHMISWEVPRQSYADNETGLVLIIETDRSCSGWRDRVHDHVSSPIL